MQISKQAISSLSRDTNKDKPLGVHISDALHINKYWQWTPKQQSRKGFKPLKKLMKSPFQYLFNDHIFSGTWFKIKYFISNKPSCDNANRSGKKKI